MDLEKIKSITLEATKVDEALFVGTARREEIVDARRAFAVAAREFGIPYSAIGKAVNRDHTTAIHYATKAKDLMSIYPPIRKKYNRIIDLCRKADEAERLFDAENSSGLQAWREFVDAGQNIPIGKILNQMQVGNLLVTVSVFEQSTARSNA